MNNKGQVLVLFVMILPIILLLILFVYNEVTLYGEKQKQNDLALSLCRYYKKGASISKLEEIALKSDKELSIKINEENNTIKIIMVKEMEDPLNKKNKIKTKITCK